MASLACEARAQPACAAPAPVCDARDAVFIVSAFEPFASAVRIAADLLVTNRHVVADADTVRIMRPDGRIVDGSVVPTAYDGDLALIESADLGDGPVLADLGDARMDTDLYTVAGDDALGAVRAFEPGRLLIEPAPGAPRPRLHHGAQSQPGNSGGALVDARGRLVGIVASGGENRFEAMPSADIAVLLGASGAHYEAVDAAMGEATRTCVETMEGVQGGLDDAAAEALAEACTASANRQLYDLAAQALGRARRFDAAVTLLVAGLERDPHALNARVALAMTYMFMQRFEDAVPHLAFLVGHIGDDAAVLRLAIQAAARAGDAELGDTALARIEQHHPDLVDWANRLLEAVAQ